MLTPLTQFTPTFRLDAAIARPHYVALCPTTGATLSASFGRSKSGNGRTYVLILPNEPVDERGLLGSYSWDNEGRKKFRAATLEEAIEKANQKLAKMLEKRAKESSNV